MDIVLSIITSVLYGFFTCFLSAAMLLVWYRKKSPEADYPVYWSLPLALVFGWAAGFSKVLGAWIPDFPPTDSTHWLFFLGLPLVIIGLWQAIKEWPLKAHFIVQWGILAGLFYLLLKPLTDEWSLLNMGLVFGGVSFVFALVGVWFTQLGKTQPAPLFTFLFTALIMSCSAFFILGHSASLNQLTVILGSLSGVLFLASLLYPNMNLSRGGLTVLYPTLIGLSVSAYYFAELSWWILLLPFSFVFLYLNQLPFLKEKSHWVRALLIVFCALSIHGLALGATYFTPEPEENSDPYSEYYN